jgi:hypothetical protein
MRRGGALIVSILLLVGAFYLGVQYERNNCKIDLPNAPNQVENSVRCRDFRSDVDVR